MNRDFRFGGPDQDPLYTHSLSVAPISSSPVVLLPTLVRSRGDYSARRGPRGLHLSQLLAKIYIFGLGLLMGQNVRYLGRIISLGLRRTCTALETHDMPNVTSVLRREIRRFPAS